MTTDRQTDRQTEGRTAKRRDARFWRRVLFANLLVFALAFALAELGVRIWREGSIGAGFASLLDDHPVPHNLGTGGWLMPDAARGYALRPEHDGVNALHIRHGAIATPKPTGTFRVLLLGDSITWPEDGYAALLQQALADARAPTIEVINAAVPGYTTWQERHHLELLLEPIAPDLVVLQYCCNDNHRFLHQLTDNGDWLITAEARRTLLPEGDDAWTRFCRWSYLALEVRQRLLAQRHAASGPFAWQDDPGFAAAWRDDSWPLVEGELDAMHRLLTARHVPLVVMAVPFAPQLADTALATDRAYTLRPQAHLAAICSARAVPLLDLHAPLLAHRDDDLFVDGIHFTPHGHRLAADLLLHELRDRHLVPGR